MFCYSTDTTVIVAKITTDMGVRHTMAYKSIATFLVRQMETRNVEATMLTVCIVVSDNDNNNDTPLARGK